MEVNTKQLTFTRFIAAYLIVIFHFGKEVFPFFREEINFIFKQANIGVSYFFILSGFVMIIAYRNKKVISTKKYLVNRMARIVPVYYLSMILFFIGMMLGYTKLNLTSFFMQIFMIQSWFPGYVIATNVPTWSIVVEIFFYVLFPILFNRFYRNNLRKTSIIISLIWLFSQILHHILVFLYGNHEVLRELVYYFPIFHLNEFLIGNLFSLLFLQYGTKKQNNYDFLLMLLIFLIILFLRYPFNFDFHNGLLAIFFAPLILLLAMNKGFISKLFSSKYFVFMGDISYSMYILQLPIYIFARQLPIENKTVLFFLYSLLLIILSIFSYLYIEKPMRETIKNKFSNND